MKWSWFSSLHVPHNPLSCFDTLALVPVLLALRLDQCESVPYALKQPSLMRKFLQCHIGREKQHAIKGRLMTTPQGSNRSEGQVCACSSLLRFGCLQCIKSSLRKPFTFSLLYWLFEFVSFALFSSQNLNSVIYMNIYIYVCTYIYIYGVHMSILHISCISHICLYIYAYMAYECLFPAKPCYITISGSLAFVFSTMINHVY
jgi:hypothetical protein